MIVGIAMVRDEEDIIGYTLQHLLAEGVDHLIVADNLSTDGTRPLLSMLAEKHPITVVDDLEPGYYQDVKMTRLAYQAADMGATWVLPFDADELFYGSLGTVAESLSVCSADVIRATGWDHIATTADPDVPNPFLRITHRRPIPQKLPKVAFRPAEGMRLHMGNHDVDHPGVKVNGVLSLRHFGARSLVQFKRKVRNGKQAYDATNLHPTYGTHWRIRGGLPDQALEAEWDEMCNEPDLIHDPAPYRCLQ